MLVPVVFEDEEIATEEKEANQKTSFQTDHTIPKEKHPFILRGLLILSLKGEIHTQSLLLRVKSTEEEIEGIADPVVEFKEAAEQCSVYQYIQSIRFGLVNANQNNLAVQQKYEQREKATIKPYIGLWYTSQTQ